jgi:hypothetical protein
LCRGCAPAQAPGRRAPAPRALRTPGSGGAGPTSSLVVFVASALRLALLNRGARHCLATSVTRHHPHTHTPTHPPTPTHTHTHNPLPPRHPAWPRSHFEREPAWKAGNSRSPRHKFCPAPRLSPGALSGANLPPANCARCLAAIAASHQIRPLSWSCRHEMG